MKKNLYIIGVLSALLLFAFQSNMVENKKNVFILVSKKKVYQAGYPIKLEFSSKSKSEKPTLFLIHSYGKTLLEAYYKNGTYNFEIPMNYCQKTGVVSWFLINKNEKSIAGNFEIMPNEHTKSKIENYLGPRSILAGSIEHTMMVSVPTDGFDNPVVENTQTLIKYQFLNKVVATPKQTQNFLAWKKIYSESKSGKILVSTECNTTTSKEIETEVYPNIPTDFTISYNRNHDFADGNQITTFSTTIIKDRYGNTVCDGTLVTFIVSTAQKALLRTYGTTINGIAKAQLLHPDHAENYIIKAFVTGIATSNALQLSYKSIMRSFTYSFSNKNRTLIVGPLKSFMNQLVPDGIRITVKVYSGNKLVTVLNEESKKGFATFIVSSDFYKEKKYRFKITALGITHTTETKNYDVN